MERKGKMDEETKIVAKATQTVINEMGRGAKKFGKYASMHEAASVIREEFDEFWDEVKVNNKERAISEAVQVAATALRFVVEFQ